MSSTSMYEIVTKISAPLQVLQLLYGVYIKWK